MMDQRLNDLLNHFENNLEEFEYMEIDKGYPKLRSVKVPENVFFLKFLNDFDTDQPPENGGKGARCARPEELAA